MKKKINSSDIFGFVKPLVDIHTLGLSTIANLLMDCGYRVYIANNDVNEAVQNLRKLNNYGLLKKWILEKQITRLGISYRLDPVEGYDYFMSIYEHLLVDKMFSAVGGPLTQLIFAGLPETSIRVKENTDSTVIVFPGNETPIESLTKLNVPKEYLPNELIQDNAYDNMRWDFAMKLIESGKWRLESYKDHYGYPSCGSNKDRYEDRLNYAKTKQSLPIIRTHSGPYNPDRLEALKEYNSWVKDLAQSKLLDVLSIGSSQLTQSHFGEDWKDIPNGGGVPVNSDVEYSIIRDNAYPMLVRTYSGTKNVPELARIHERSLNISWHALSFWWFNELDGRGNSTLLDNLKEHFETVRYAVSTDKPVEPNVPHHFAFRGADDITYILSGYLAAKACKKMGLRHLILQNMLNTPKYTWGSQDLAKGRTMVNLVRSLEDANFKVSVQTRAGLDYFAPDLENAKIQLAAVTCLMDDIDPSNNNSPEIIHVVNYSEAVCLATPTIIKESIQITLSALHEYRLARKLGKIPNMRFDPDVNERTDSLYEECRTSIELLEKAIPNLYTPEGFFKVFVEGFLPVPYLMDHNRKYPKATQYKTAIKNGGIRVVDDESNIIYTPTRFKKIIEQMQ